MRKWRNEDAPDLESGISETRCVGSSPTFRTNHLFLLGDKYCYIGTIRQTDPLSSLKKRKKEGSQPYQILREPVSLPLLTGSKICGIGVMVAAADLKSAEQFVRASSTLASRTI